MTARTLSFEYAGLTIGAGQVDSNYTLTNRYRFEHAYPQAELTFEVFISATTPAAFLVSEAALLAAYRKPDQALTVQLTATDRHTFDPADNSGLNIRATAEKVPGRDSTDRSARYRCTVTAGLPADLAGRAGRRSSSVEVSESPAGRRTVDISGVYTALASNAARKQFEDEIGAYAAAALAALPTPGTFELVQTPQATADDQDKLLRFRRVYKEILRDQSAAGADLAAVVDPSLVIRRSVAQTDSPVLAGLQAEPPLTMRVEYAADVRFSETTDLRDLWESTLRDFVLTEVEASTGAAVLAVTAEDWGLDLPDNRIEVTMDILGDGAANFWQLRRDWQESRNSGVILRPVWDGNPFSRDKYQGPASHTLSLTYITVGPSLSGSQGPGGMPGVAHPAAPAIDGFLHVRTGRRMRERSVGIAGEEVPIYLATTQYFYTRVDATESGTELGTTSERGSTV